MNMPTTKTDTPDYLVGYDNGYQVLVPVGATPGFGGSSERRPALFTDNTYTSLVGANGVPVPVSGAGNTFATFPSAAAAGVGALQWESTFGALFRSDGTYWRPAYGQQLLSRLAAESQMAVNSTLQVIDSITIPAGMWAPGCELLMRLGANKAGGTSDTLTLRLKIATNIVSAPTIATTQTGAGGQFLIKRQSATSVQQAGGSNNTSWTQLAGAVSTARSAATTVPSLDATDTVIELSGQMTTGSAEYGIVNSYSLWLVG